MALEPHLRAISVERARDAADVIDIFQQRLRNHAGGSETPDRSVNSIPSIDATFWHAFCSEDGNANDCDGVSPHSEVPAPPPPAEEFDYTIVIWYRLAKRPRIGRILGFWPSDYERNKPIEVNALVWLPITPSVHKISGASTRVPGLPLASDPGLATSISVSSRESVPAAERSQPTQEATRVPRLGALVYVERPVLPATVCRIDAVQNCERLWAWMKVAERGESPLSSCPVEDSTDAQVAFFLLIWGASLCGKLDALRAVYKRQANIPVRSTIPSIDAEITRLEVGQPTRAQRHCSAMGVFMTDLVRILSSQ